MTGDRAVRWVISRPAALRARWRARVVQPPGRPVVVAAVVVVTVVAAWAGVVSYGHITALGLRTHQGSFDAHVLAIPIDGLIVAGSVILAAGSALGWIGVVLGVAATLFANLEYGLPYGWLSGLVSTWPAVAFTAACFMLERWLRSRRRQAPATHPAFTVPRDNLDAAIMAAMATEWAGNALSERALAKQFELPPKVVRKVRQAVLAEANGHGPQEAGMEQPE